MQRFLRLAYLKTNIKPRTTNTAMDRAYADKAVKQTLDFLEATLKGENKVIDLRLPDELKSLVDISIKNEACSKDDLLKACMDVMKYQTKPYHPHFHNQLFGGFNEFSFLGAMMTPAINGSIFTYELAPVFTLMEFELFEHMRKQIGWDQIDATMCPGGSFANFMGLHLSRHKLHAEFNKTGMQGNLKIFTSEVCHYSMFKGAILCGIGSNNLIYVKTDENRRMIPEELERCIIEEKQKGYEALIVNTTTGTTVEGAIDPVTEIGHICKKYGIWHHVDGAYGGSLMLSNKLRPKLGNFDNVDSMSFDPHKAPSIPVFATLFMTKHVGLMAKCNSAKADYLFHKERESYDNSLDVGDKTLQCTRALDILKCWTYFKGCGWNGVEQQLNYQYKLAQWIRDYIKARPKSFEMAVDNVETFNVCFWYIPKDMPENSFKSRDAFLKMISKVTVLAKKFMIEEGQILVGYSTSKMPYYFWRITMSNPQCTVEQIETDMKMLGEYCEMAYEQIMKERAAKGKPHPKK